MPSKKVIRKNRKASKKIVRKGSRKASKKIVRKGSRKASKKIVRKGSRKASKKIIRKATRRYRMTDKEIMEAGSRYGEKIASGLIKAKKGYQTIKSSAQKGVSKTKEVYGKVKSSAQKGVSKVKELYGKAKRKYDVTKAGVKGAVKGYKETVAVQEAYRNVFPDYFKAPRLF